MILSVWLSLVAAAWALAAAILVLWRNPKALPQWLFLIGMLLFGVESILMAAAEQQAVRTSLRDGYMVEDLIRASTLTLALLPGTWLAFALVYSRAEYRRFLHRWRWLLVLMFAVPLGLWFRDNFGDYTPMYPSGVAATSQSNLFLTPGDDEVRYGWGPGEVVVEEGLALPEGANSNAGRIGSLVEVRGEEEKRAYGWLELTPGGRGLVLRYNYHQRLLHILLLVGSVLVLMNLERTFRASVGTMRWRVKLILLGLVVLFVVRIYSSSNVVLLEGRSTFATILHPGALLMASGLILVSLLRARVFEIAVYPSRTLLERSVVVLLVGIYLVAVVAVAWVVRGLGGRFAVSRELLLALIALGILASMVLLTLLLLSDRLRQAISRFVSRHLRRPRYDYRHVWRTFTERTAGHVGHGEFCVAVVRWVSATFDTLSVSLWIIDEARRRVDLGASTVVNSADWRELEPIRADVPRLARMLRDQAAPFDVDWVGDEVRADLQQLNRDQFGKGGGRFMVPLLVGEDLLGVLALGDRVSGASFTLEDIELLKSVCDHTANHLLGIHLSQRLIEAREIQAFQTMSTFFVHDLKNVASTLSLMLKNLPIHFDNPEFRADALKSVGASVERMNQLIRSLSELRRSLSLELKEERLGEVIRSALETLDGETRGRLKFDDGVAESVWLDAGQMQRVLMNLVLNALEASGERGEVRVRSLVRDSWAVVEIVDSGCGMAREFLENQLFRPFQTTKKRGIGIGAYQSRMIVEAHRGRIEVESEVGKGSTFRLLLPLNPPTPHGRTGLEIAAK